MLLAEAVTFDTGEVVAILAILALIGLAFIAGLAGLAYLIVTLTRGSRQRVTASGAAGHDGQFSGRPNSKWLTFGICAASAVAGVVTAWALIDANDAIAVIYLLAAFAAAGTTAFVLTILTTRRRR